MYITTIVYMYICSHFTILKKNFFGTPVTYSNKAKYHPPRCVNTSERKGSQYCLSFPLLLSQGITPLSAAEFIARTERIKHCPTLLLMYSHILCTFISYIVHSYIYANVYTNIEHQNTDAHQDITEVFSFFAQFNSSFFRFIDYIDKLKKTKIKYVCILLYKNYYMNTYKYSYLYVYFVVIDLCTLICMFVYVIGWVHTYVYDIRNKYVYKLN